MALAYARSRHQDSDYGRMARQQTLLLAIRSQLGAAMILQAPDLVTAAKGTAWTDLPRESLPNLVTLFGRAAAARVHQLGIVPPTYPEWLTSTVIAKIRSDVAALLPPVPNATPTPPASPSPAPSASSSPGPSGSPAPSLSPSPRAKPGPSPAPITDPDADGLTHAIRILSNARPKPRPEYRPSA